MVLKNHFMTRAALLLVALALIVGVGIWTVGGTERAEPSGITLLPDDHVLGNRDAPVKIFEYAEVECPYCQKLQPVLLRVINENGGKVAFVFRHFPLTLHPKSFTESTALECAGEAMGDEFFFKYLNRLYEITPSNNNIDVAILPEVANELGIPRSEFLACLSSDRYKERILRDIEEGIGRNVDSVPHLIILAPNGKQFVFGKSPSYAALNAVIEAALNEK